MVNQVKKGGMFEVGAGGDLPLRVLPGRFLNRKEVAPEKRKVESKETKSGRLPK